MPTKFVLALACCFPFAAAAQVTVTGTWKADDVAFPPWTFVLKADGNKLSGAVSQGRSDPATSTVTALVQAMEISEGAIDGNRLSFKVNANGNTIAFSGVVNGDTIYAGYDRSSARRMEEGYRCACERIGTRKPRCI